MPWQMDDLPAVWVDRWWALVKARRDHQEKREALGIGESQHVGDTRKTRLV